MDGVVAIIGSGLAGLAAAKTLADAGHPAMLIAPTQKALTLRGETLAASAVASLRQLGWLSVLDDPLTALPSEWRYYAWGGSAGLEVSRGAGWHIDRCRFEAAAASSLGSGVERIAARISAVDQTGNRWRLCLDSGGSVVTNFVIDTSGRSARIARHLGGRRRLDKLRAYVWTFAGIAPAEPATLVEAHPSGWWYSAPLPGRRFCVAAFTDADLVTASLARSPGMMAELLAAAVWTRRRLESLGLELGQPPSHIADAATIAAEKVAGPGWAAAGDAAWSMDPLASHGLAAAVWSGRMAALAAIEVLGGRADAVRRYNDVARAGFARLNDERLAFYTAVERFGDQPFWRRRTCLDGADVPASTTTSLENAAAPVLCPFPA